MKELYIIRGLPGSGKTTLARKLTSSFHYEADQYFTDANGEYKFNREHLSDAHAQCQKYVKHAMNYEASPIIVSNTFIKRWEMQAYLDMAAQYDYRVIEMTMSGPLYPNVHGVPDEVIERMKQNWEK